MVRVAPECEKSRKPVAPDSLLIGKEAEILSSTIKTFGVKTRVRLCFL